MAKPLGNLIDKLDQDVVFEARERAAEIILELKLNQLREELDVSQHTLARSLGISQPAVAKLEGRGEEIKISSLRRYVKALGGKLTIDVELPGGRHIDLTPQ